jgi:hypothetical protein
LFIAEKAVLLFHAIQDRQRTIKPELVAIIKYIDGLYEENEGIDLFKALDAVNRFPNDITDPFEVLGNLSAAVFAPFIRLSGTYKRQVLIDSINNEIKIINTVPDFISQVRKQADTIQRRLGHHSNKTRFEVVYRDLNAAGKKKIITYDTTKTFYTRTTNFYAIKDTKRKSTTKEREPIFSENMKNTKAVYVYPINTQGN